MKIKNFKTTLATGIFLVAMSMFITSCNRGVGCPNNFSIEQPTAPECNIVD